MQERKNTLNEGSMNGGIQERRKIGKEGDKKREMQKKRIQESRVSAFRK